MIIMIDDDSNDADDQDCHLPFDQIAWTVDSRRSVFGWLARLRVRYRLRHRNNIPGYMSRYIRKFKMDKFDT